jgi:hypothetical protein
MFDLDVYFAQLDSRLNACRAQMVVLNREGPHVSLRGHQWAKVTLDLDIEWKTGEVLSAGDYWYREHNEILHVIHYQFMHADKSEIFRFSTHGEFISHGDTCCVHTPIGTLEDDDARLHGFRLSSITLIHAWDLIQKHLRGERMPWEV